MYLKQTLTVFRFAAIGADLLGMPTLLLWLSGNWRWVEALVFGAWFTAFFGACLMLLYCEDPALLAERFRKPWGRGESRSGLVLLDLLGKVAISQSKCRHIRTDLMIGQENHLQVGEAALENALHRAERIGPTEQHLCWARPPSPPRHAAWLSAAPRCRRAITARSSRCESTAPPLACQGK